MRLLICKMMLLGMAASVSSSCSAGPATPAKKNVAKQAGATTTAAQNTDGNTDATETLVLATDAKTACTLMVPAMHANPPVTAEEQAPPIAWGSKNMSWSGPCTNGKANGTGVARMLSGGRVIGAWYGSAIEGNLEMGVIEDGNSFDTAENKNDKLVSLDRSDENIARYDQAQSLAKQAVSELISGFEKSGNAASAQYYSDIQNTIQSLNAGE